MATSARASAVIPAPIDTVWQNLRDFTFPEKLLTTIEKCTIEGGASPSTVGAVRVLVYKGDGQIRKQRLLALDDQFFKLTYESIEAQPELETSAAITTIQCHSITETNQTLVSWSTDFAGNTPGDFVLFEQKSYKKNLEEIRDKLTKK